MRSVVKAPRPARDRRSTTLARALARTSLLVVLGALSCSSSDDAAVEEPTIGPEAGRADATGIDSMGEVGDGGDSGKKASQDSSTDGSKSDGAALVCGEPQWNGPYTLPDGVCSIDGFCEQTHFPSYSRMKRAWAATATDVWMTSDQGIFHYDGVRWRGLTGIPLQIFNGAPVVAGSGPSDVWIGGTLHWDGVKLVKAAKGVPTYTQAMWFASPTDGWAANDSAVYHWNGATWTAVPTMAPFGVRALHGFASNDVWAGGPVALVHWNGVSWSPAPVPLPNNAMTVTVIGGASKDDFWVGGGKLVHYLSGAWTEYAELENVRAIAGRTTDDQTFIVDRPLGGTRVVHWNGTSFDVDAIADQDCSSCGHCSHVAAAPDGTRVFAAGAPFPGMSTMCPVPGLSRSMGLRSLPIERIVAFKDSSLSLAGGKIYRGESQDEAMVWGTSSEDVAVSLSGKGPNDVWVAGYSPSANITAHFDGVTWSVAPLPSVDSRPSSAIAATSPTNAWVLMGGHAAHWNGTMWTATPSSNVPGLRAIWGSSATDVWAVGEYGVSHWKGATWTHLPSLPGPVNPGRFIAIGGTSASDVTVVHTSTNGNVTLYHWNGAIWSMVPEGYTSIDPNLGDRAVSVVAPNDIWSLFTDQIIKHWDGTCFRWVTTGPPNPPSRAIAIGASASSVLVASPPQTVRLAR